LDGVRLRPTNSEFEGERGRERVTCPGGVDDLSDTMSGIVTAGAGTVGDVADIRDTAEADSTERVDPAQRHQVPTADETAAAVARAQAALAEIEARRAADAEREARDAEQTQRREELTRWAEQDRTAEPAVRHEQADDDSTVLQR
jgi:hypothetical protein